MPDSPAPAAQRDNLLGICHALGTALGFDPNWLRLALSALLLVGLPVALGAYALCGVIVLAERLISQSFPGPRHAAA